MTSHDKRAYPFVFGRITSIEIVAKFISYCCNALYCCLVSGLLSIVPFSDVSIEYNMGDGSKDSAL